MNNDTTAAWTFILANATMIEKFCGRVAASSPWLNDEDFHSEVIAEIATKFDTWDQGRSPSGSSFVWWQIRKIRLRIARKMAKTPCPLGDGLQKSEDEAGRPSKLDSLVANGPLDAFKTAQLKEALDTATDGQLDAAIIIAEGLSGDEVKARFGVTRQSAINRMGRLKAKVSE